jgi:hypothetical protein
LTYITLAQLHQENFFAVPIGTVERDMGLHEYSLLSLTLSRNEGREGGEGREVFR